MQVPVYVFVDNSNLFIEGKKAVADREALGTWRLQRSYRELQEMRLDYGALINNILGDRKLGQAPFIVGTRPPQSDSLWRSWREQGMAVEVLDRNCINQEKAVDATLIVEAMEVLYTKEKGVVVLIAGDGDFKPLLHKVIAKGWETEVYFWRRGETSDEITFGAPASRTEPQPVVAATNAWMMSSSLLKFNALETLYKTFTFATGPARASEHKHAVEVTSKDPTLLSTWKNVDVLQVMKPTNLFTWIDWINDDKVCLYFTRQDLAEKAAMKIAENEQLCAHAVVIP